MGLSHSFIVLLLAVLASGAITNTTVDDSSSSFIFTGTWNTITPSSPCTICSAKPDPSRTHGGTWHDGNIRNGAPVGTSGSFTFTGSAVYIFGIDQAISQPDIAFTLGSIQQTHHYTGSEQFVYDALFFSATGLPADQTHTVNWVFNIANTGVSVQAALFDYAIVTNGEEDVKTAAGTTEPGANQPTPGDNQPTTSSKKTASSTHSSVSDQSNKSETSQLNPTSSAGNSPSSLSVTDSLSTNPGHPTPSSVVTVTTNSAGVVITVTAPAQAASFGSASNSNKMGVIIGAVVGALAIATFVVLFLWLRRRRRVRRIETQTDKAARSQFLRIEDYPLHSMRSSSSQPNAREVRHSTPISLSTSGAKIRHRNNASLADLTGASLSSPADGDTTTSTQSDSSRPPPEAERAAAVIIPPTSSTTNLQFLEERVATLEAQIAIHQHPPPYIHEDDD